MNETAAVNLEPDEPRGARGMDVAQARRMAIDAARRIIARGDVGRMTLDSVGHEAGLPIGALASHFNTEQELLQKVAEHAQEAHGVTEVTPELLTKVKSAIVSK